MEILVFKAVKTPDALKAQLVSKWLNSSKPLADFAQEMKISPEAFSGWVAKYRKKASIRRRTRDPGSSESITLVKIELKNFANSDDIFNEVAK